MNKYKAKNNLKGFTLAELVIVMLLLALVTGMITTIVILVNKSEKRAELDSDVESELIQLEETFMDFMLSCDKSEYNIVISGNSIKIDDDFYMNCDDGILTVKIADKQKSIEFIAIKTVEFALSDGNIVKCTAKTDNYTHKILYYKRTD